MVLAGRYVATGHVKKKESNASRKGINRLNTVIQEGKIDSLRMSSFMFLNIITIDNCGF